ncbi:MAG: sigma-54-dependent Fis family transcriptional regulator [Deltaproteobacteria bacterium]|nr:sigma-54-dependent Fis family transcriptional regulator [Deltaproteobacteria bacterium]
MQTVSIKHESPASLPHPEAKEAHHTVLVCDDEELIRWSLSEHLKGSGYGVMVAKNGQECLEAATRQVPDAILLDLKMPVMDGLTALRKLREAGILTPVIVITAHGAVDTAIEATRLGAVAYLTKPFDLREVSFKLSQAIEADRLATEVRYLRDRRRADYRSIIGESGPMQGVFDTLRRLEGVDAPTVLVTGESGTGKELVAQAIHSNGPRKDGPFVEIDCASLPETLIESEIFGHERGAFTDARQMKRGLFEVAHSGTIFLDEIGEMSLGTQAKFLRALENRRFKRVGGVVDIPLEAGIVAATHRDLAVEVEKGRFRQDLYYRLAVIPILMPSLRQRPSDIPILVSHFLDHFRRRIPSKLEGIEPEALGALQRYPWPGNVRELRNIIERIVTLHREETQVRLVHLPSEVRYAGKVEVQTRPGSFILPDQGCHLEEVEKSLLVQALERVKGNQTQAAKLLGITRYALRYRMEKFGLKD